MKLLVYFLPLVLMLFACTNISTRPKDDLPNMITGRVVDGLNLPSVGARVTIKNIVVRNGEIELRESDTVTTDSLGQFEFVGLSNTRFCVSASQDAYSRILSRINLLTDTLFVGDITLSPKINIKGRVITENNETVLVSIPQTTNSVLTDENGFYVLESVPPGNYDIAFIFGNTVNFLPISVNSHRDTVFVMDVVLTENEGENAVSNHFFDVESMTSLSISPVRYAAGEVPDWYQNRNFSLINYYMPVSPFVYERVEPHEPLRRVLIEDFANFTGRAAYTRHISYSDPTAGLWYFFSDVNDGGNSHALENITQSDISAAVVRVDDTRNAVELNMVLDANFEFPHAGIGFNFLGENRFLDLSQLETVEFWARGNNRSVRFEFLSNFVLQYPPENNWGHLGSGFTPNNSWQRFEFQAASFYAPVNSAQRAEGILWSNIASEIQGFNFITENMHGDTIFFSVSDIYFHGVDITTFLE